MSNEKDGLDDFQQRIEKIAAVVLASLVTLPGVVFAGQNEDIKQIQAARTAVKFALALDDEIRTL